MLNENATIAVFGRHAEAEAAVHELAAAGFDLKKLSIVGKGYHTEEQATGFYNLGDRMVFWGKQGAVWGGLWGLFVGGVFLTVPVVGNIIVLGTLAAALVSMLEGAVVIGGVSALGAALFSLGIPRDSVVNYEAMVKADGFLVMVQGDSADMARAKDILERGTPARLDIHRGLTPGLPQGPATIAA